MAEKILLDPFEIWKSVYDKTEENLNGVIHETLKTEAFSEWLGQVQSGYLQYREHIQKTTDEYLKQINMPTREEITNIASLIINVEEKVEGLEQKIEEELLDDSLSAEVSKLKSNIFKLDKKMDQILKILQQETTTTELTKASGSSKKNNKEV